MFCMCVRKSSFVWVSTFERKSIASLRRRRVLGGGRAFRANRFFVEVKFCVQVGISVKFDLFVSQVLCRNRVLCGS